MGNNRIEFFVPPSYPKYDFDFEEFKALTNKGFEYCSRGRHAIFHTLKALCVKDKVVLPAYSCPTIRESVVAAGLEYIVCDIDKEDLNISFNDFVRICEKNDGIGCVIVPSLYGNPADLTAFERYCAEHDIDMIDDAAQSFGAKLDGKYLSTFGNAGFVAFSPGKSTPAPMGALYWHDGEYSFKWTAHNLIHRLIYKNYCVNREGAYEERSDIFRKLISRAAFYAEKIFCLRNDTCMPFEMSNIGGALHACLDGDFAFRDKYFSEFCERFDGNEYFAVVKAKRGEPVYPKIALLAASADIRDRLAAYLKVKNISTYCGYGVFAGAEDVPFATELSKCVLELPIENNKERMDYLFDCVSSFIDNEKGE